MQQNNLENFEIKDLKALAFDLIMKKEANEHQLGKIIQAIAKKSAPQATNKIETKQEETKND